MKSFALATAVETGGAIFTELGVVYDRRNVLEAVEVLMRKISKGLVNIYQPGRLVLLL